MLEVTGTNHLQGNEQCSLSQLAPSLLSVGVALARWRLLGLKCLRWVEPFLHLMCGREEWARPAPVDGQRRGSFCFTF